MKFKFFDQCDRFRCNPRREGQWQSMMRNKKKITQQEFERHVDPSGILDPGESLTDWISTSGDGQFYKSQIGDETVYFIQAAGFEFIFRDPRATESLREASGRIACGQCFSFANTLGREMLDDGIIPERDIHIVHGTVIEPFAEDPNRHVHAWVEAKGKVRDWQLKIAGKHYLPTREFYKLFEPENVVKYSVEEAMLNMVRFGHQGPWDRKLLRMESLSEDFTIKFPQKQCSTIAIRKLTKIAVDDRIRTVFETFEKLEELGFTRELSPTKKWRGKTVDQFNGRTKITGLAFVEGHVMPIVNGKVSNIVGHGDEPLEIVAAIGCTKNEEQHGMVGTPEYNTWRGMKMRCTNPNHRYYPDYGGRGISFHKRWGNFAEFYKDMGPRPKGHTLDRINVNKGYGPGNCVWADIVTQNRNRRNVKSENLHSKLVAEVVDKLLGLREAKGRFLYHTTSMSALASILNQKTLKPLSGEGFISFSETPFTGDIRGNDVTLAFDLQKLANKLLKVRYDEAWYNSHEEQAAYIAGEGWREQFVLPDYLFDPPPDIPPDEADFWEPEPEEIEAAERDAEIDAFLAKDREREWITRRAGEKVKFSKDDLEGVLVQRTGDEGRAMKMLDKTGMGDVLVSTKRTGIFEGREHGRLLPDVEPERYGGRNVKVAIYRAASEKIGEFNTMDYVTMNLRFALEHAKHQAAVTEEPQVILRARVPAEQVAEAYNPGEWFYVGPGVKGSVFKRVKP